jgi:ribose transport system permease protein
MFARLKSIVFGNPLVRDYAMIFVLLLLVGLFSVLTLKQQNPTGAEAGRQVADLILAQSGDQARVVIVGRSTEQDRQFAEAARERILERGGVVLAVVHGGAPDARRALEEIVATGQSIDAIAANSVTARWSVYDRFPSVGSEKCVTPRTYRWPDFLKSSNLLGVANQTAIAAIIAIGMTMVIITAGIDLSVGSLVALAAVCSTVFLREQGGGTSAGIGMVILGCLIGIAICGLAGLLNGTFVTAFEVPPFIATLGMMMMASGLAFRLSGGRSIPELPPAFFYLGQGKLGGIPIPVVLLIGLYLIAHLIMSRTIFGRYVYAIGGNLEAARLSGVPVKRILLVVYATSGALAGLGGIMLASQLEAGDPKFGQMYELQVIAAVVVGGTSITGGRGTLIGTLIGAALLGTIGTALPNPAR